MRARLARLAELRRALPLAAAGLLLVALALPVWRIVLTAPQYPGQPLVVELFAYPRLGGDFQEVQALNKYVGFYYPDPVFVDPNWTVYEAAIETPEWVLGPLAFLGVAAAGVFVSLAPTDRKLRAGLLGQLVGTVVTFGGMFAFIQYRLFQAGHALDPNAPLSGVDGFTPPVLGTYEVANISGYAWFGPGGYLTAIAIALIAAAFVLRDSRATVGDVPGALRTGLDRGRGRIRRSRGGRGSDGPDGREPDRSAHEGAARRESPTGSPDPRASTPGSASPRTSTTGNPHPGTSTGVDPDPDREVRPP